MVRKVTKINEMVAVLWKKLPANATWKDTAVQDSVRKMSKVLYTEFQLPLAFSLTALCNKFNSFKKGQGRESKKAESKGPGSPPTSSPLPMKHKIAPTKRGRPSNESRYEQDVLQVKHERATSKQPKSKSTYAAEGIEDVEEDFPTRTSSTSSSSTSSLPKASKKRSLSKVSVMTLGPCAIGLNPKTSTSGRAEVYARAQVVDLNAARVYPALIEASEYDEKVDYVVVTVGSPIGDKGERLFAWAPVLH